MSTPEDNAAFTRRFICAIVEMGHVHGWTHPPIATLSGMPPSPSKRTVKVPFTTLPEEP
jgi:hypothetical protein